MRPIEDIIVHCSYTPPSMDIGAARIRQWHTSPDPNDPSKPWSDIGYHFVIRRNGNIETGRPLEIAGAHTKGKNARSVGICLVGGMHETSRRSEFNFTRSQMISLNSLLARLQGQFPLAEVSGHRDWDNRDCPCFDVKSYMDVHYV